MPIPLKKYHDIKAKTEEMIASEAKDVTFSDDFDKEKFWQDMQKSMMEVSIKFEQLKDD